MSGLSVRRVAAKTEPTPCTSVGSPACVPVPWHLNKWSAKDSQTARYLPGGKEGAKYLEVGREVKVGNSSVGICRSNSEGLSGGARASNASRSSVAVGCGTEHNSPDRITISDGILEPLYNDSTNSLRLHISVSGHIKGVAQRSGLETRIMESALLYREDLRTKARVGSMNALQLLRWYEGKKRSES